MPAGVTSSFFCSKITRRYLHGLFSVCCVVSVLLCMYSVVNPRWYGAETSRAATAANPTAIEGGLSIAPWYSCGRMDGVWRCEEFTFNGDLPANGDCPARGEGEVKSYIYAIRAMVIITGIFMGMGAVIASIGSAAGPVSARFGSSLLIACSLLAVIINIVGIALSAAFYKNKLYCDDGYCLIATDNDPTIRCEEKFFHGALTYYIGIICPVVALIISIFLFVSAKRVVVPRGVPQPIATSSSSAAYSDKNRNNFDDGNNHRGPSANNNSNVPSPGTRAANNNRDGYNNYSYNNNNGSGDYSYLHNRSGAPYDEIDDGGHNNTNLSRRGGGNNNNNNNANHQPFSNISRSGSMNNNIAVEMQQRQRSTRNNSPMGNDYTYNNNNSAAPTAGAKRGNVNVAPTISPRNGGGAGPQQQDDGDGDGDGEVIFQPPEGDWEWDPNSNMYWSEDQYLFLNPNDGHFFDPNSEQWYNPETEEWYA